MVPAFAGLIIAAFLGLGPSDIAALREPGTQLPAVTLPSLDGGTLSLRSDDGRPTVIVVFASWCDPCRANMPAILGLARSNNARFIGIDELESPKAARAFVRAAGVTFQTGLLTSPSFEAPGVTDEQRAATGIDIPAIYLIDSDGKSYEAFVGAEATNVSHVESALSRLRKPLCI
jgi:thiol-disulfide isomerase/thioredoxin